MEEDQKPFDSGITPFAVTTFRNRERVFGIKVDDRRRHVYIIGKTGMGKTTLIENMVYSDIVAGHGVCYIDPHGDTAEKMLAWIPSNRINDVVYFNPADINFPISFNVLEKVAPEYRHLVSAGLIGVFKKQWADSWGPRLEYILRNAILALLEYPDSTLLGINRILVDKVYRNKVVDKVQDPVVRSFWVDEFTKWNDRVLQEVISPIQNKVGQFLSTALIRNIVGQVKSTVDLRKIMDEGKILILNLSKGRIGEDSSAMLGAMMVTKIQLAAMSRVDIHEDQRKDFYLYVDEFQNFVTDSFADILSEARKYHLNLIIAHQYIEQLGEVVKPAVFGNVGTLICFRVGAEDGEFLEKEFQPDIMQIDLVNLPKFHIYLKLMIDGVSSSPFSAKGLPPIYSESMGNEQKVIAASRERYAKPRDVVEDKIKRWSGMLDGPEEGESNRPAAKSERPVAGATKVQEFRPARDNTKSAKPRRDKDAKSGEKKPMFMATCFTCKKQVEVPFKPDNVRPIFCKDCLKKSRRGEIAMPKASEVLPEDKQAGVSLNKIQNQTVNFSGQAIVPPTASASQPSPMKPAVKPQPVAQPAVARPQPQPVAPRIQPKAVAAPQPQAKAEPAPVKPVGAIKPQVEAKKPLEPQPKPEIKEPESHKLPSANLLGDMGDTQPVKPNQEIKL